MSDVKKPELKTFLIETVFKISDLNTNTEIPLDQQGKSLFQLNNSGEQIRDITLDYKTNERFFGDYKDIGSELANKYPEFLGAEIVKTLVPRTSVTYGRFILVMNMLNDLIFWYQEEKHNFSKAQAFRLAQQRGYRFVYLENLS